MAHVFRFLGTLADDGHWRLDREESRHAIKVLRLSQGAAVEVTDGEGRWAEGEIAVASDKETLIRAAEPVTEPQVISPLCLALGALKPASLDDLIPGLVELGIDELHIFLQEGTDKGRLQEKVLDRWARIMAGAGKQSKRAWFPKLMTYPGFPQFLEKNRAALSARGIMLEPTANAHLINMPLSTGGVFLVVGGERGLDDKETKSLVESGVRPARLGGHILRATTAALSATAVAASRRATQ